MAKQLDPAKICSHCKGPFFVVDEGKEGGWHGVWQKQDDGSFKHLVSGLTHENAEAVAGALNERTLLGKLNKFAKAIKLK